MKDHEKRLQDWCAATGLHKCNASLPRAIGWREKYTNPEGFDHTLIMYHPQTKAYVVLTEPYAASTCEAAMRISHGLNGFPVFQIVCAPGAGIWNPPYCVPVIIGRMDHSELLMSVAKALPKIKDA